jgi:hypothetical protein
MKIVIVYNERSIFKAPDNLKEFTELVNGVFEKLNDIKKTKRLVEAKNIANDAILMYSQLLGSMKEIHEID